MQNLNNPKVVLITCGYKELTQTYQNVEHIISEDLPVNAFNSCLQSCAGDIYCFLDRDANFANDTVLDQIVKQIQIYPELGGIYTDNIINGQRTYYPSYFYFSIQKETINTPFFCRKELNIKFEPSLYYYDKALKNIGAYSILYHIPEPLFIIDTNASH